MSRTKTVTDILTRMYDLIKDEDHWITGMEAADKDGGEVDVEDTDAYAFCLIGAYKHVMYVEDSFSNLDLDEYEYYLCRALEFRDVDHLTEWNDGHQHSQVKERIISSIDKIITGIVDLDPYGEEEEEEEEEELPFDEFTGTGT